MTSKPPFPPQNPLTFGESKTFMLELMEELEADRHAKLRDNPPVWLRVVYALASVGGAAMGVYLAARFG